MRTAISIYTSRCGVVLRHRDKFACSFMACISAPQYLTEAKRLHEVHGKITYVHPSYSIDSDQIWYCESTTHVGAAEFHFCAHPSSPYGDRGKE
jgi:hypothetical protein